MPLLFGPLPEARLPEYIACRPAYPRLSPVTGGSDMDRDADLDSLGAGARLVATTEKAVQANLRRSLARLQDEGVTFDEVVFATSRPLSATTREKLMGIAAEFGAKLAQPFDRTWFAIRLLHSPEPATSEDSVPLGRLEPTGRTQ